jgi:GNAT superfamily N-acetyltransferase
VEILIRHGDYSLAREVKQQICDLYDAVFSSHPFVWNSGDSQSHSEELEKLMSLSTFEATVAFADHKVVGFAYGHRLPVTHGWWSGFPEPLPEDFTKEWDGRTFTLVDYAVNPRYRGIGVGRRLHDGVLAARPEERAVLSVQPTAVETELIYEHMGWTRVGRKGPLEGVLPPYWDIFCLQLSSLRSEVARKEEDH